MLFCPFWEEIVLQRSNIESPSKTPKIFRRLWQNAVCSSCRTASASPSSTFLYLLPFLQETKKDVIKETTTSHMCINLGIGSVLYNGCIILITDA
ncbi:hypothetical protein AQUCO_01700152v1 [Aquilegia coerulea]|uniref:Uncharacterized protein n=1 Tax=Aquilegia coerulea TaxID=218851 RepID=A0A2G5DLH4_AQUCA|nr:hypothetical protein AQUCO_01700152v1 [Aquilegia coerulea]